MVSLINLLNEVLTTVFSVLIWPFQNAAAWLSLTVASVLCGFLMLWVFGRCSDQDAIRVIRQRLRGHLLGVRLYQHNVGTVMRFQGQIISDTGRYMRQSLAPLLVMTVPLLLILAQLNLHYAVRPIGVGDSTTVTVRFSDPSAVAIAELASVSGVEVETPGVRDTQKLEVTWRIRAIEAGRHVVQMKAGELEVDKQIVAGGDWAAVPALRSSWWVDAILYPGEPMLGSTLELFEVDYRPLSLPLLSNWLVFFLVVSMITAFAFHKAMGVEI